MSPIAKTSGRPGNVRSAVTVNRPARSTSDPISDASAAASGDAATPAAQMTVCAPTSSASSLSERIVTEAEPTSTTVCPTSGVTPSFSSARSALCESEGGKPVRMRSAVSTRSTRALRVSTWRKSRRRLSRASSAICPAISTPVGPPPTTTNVSQLRRLSSSGSTSAASNAVRISVADVEGTGERLQLGRA